MQLLRHPGRSRGAIAGIEAEAEWTASRLLRLRYRVHGEIAALRLPPRRPQLRAGGLWRTTCFEAFLAGEDGAYGEINLSPSGEWAAYLFSGYRAGMADWDLAPPVIVTRSAADLFELDAELALQPAGGCRIGLAAVIEEAGDGGLSYWALAHPPGAPDFHHPSCFALELPPPA